MLKLNILTQRTLSEIIFTDKDSKNFNIKSSIHKVFNFMREFNRLKFSETSISTINRNIPKFSCLRSLLSGIDNAIGTLTIKLSKQEVKHAPVPGI